MAIYHLHVKSVSRGGGSALAKADYIAREGKYQADQDEVLHSAHGNMPRWVEDSPKEYWKTADNFERANGRLFVHVEFALPVEITKDQQISLAENFCRELASTSQGGRLPFSLAVHRGRGDTNPHCHLMINERINDDIDRKPADWFRRANAEYPAKGGAKKADELKSRDWLRKIREMWADRANASLEINGHDVKIDHRTLAAQGIDREPQYHLGPAAAAMERKNKKVGEAVTDRGTEYGYQQEIAALEKELEALKKAKDKEVSVQLDQEKIQQGGAAEDSATSSKEKRDTPAAPLPAWIQAMKAFEAAYNREQAEDALAACVLEINKLQKEKQKIDRELKDLIEGITKAKQKMETAKILISASGDQRRHEAEAERAEQKVEAAKGAEAEAWKQLPVKYRDKFESGEIDRDRPPQKWGIFIKKETKKLILDYINAHNDAGEAARAAAISRSVAKSMEEDRETNKVKLRHWENKLTELQPALPPAQQAAHRLDRELTRAEKGLEQAKARADQLWPERIAEREKKARDRHRGRGHGGGMSM